MLVVKVKTMRLADTASIILDPRQILESRWAHDMAHVFAAAKIRSSSRSFPRRSRS